MILQQVHFSDLESSYVPFSLLVLLLGGFILDGVWCGVGERGEGLHESGE